MTAITAPLTGVNGGRGAGSGLAITTCGRLAADASLASSTSVPASRASRMFFIISPPFSFRELFLFASGSSLWLSDWRDNASNGFTADNFQIEKRDQRLYARAEIGICHRLQLRQAERTLRLDRALERIIRVNLKQEDRFVRFFPAHSAIDLCWITFRVDVRDPHADFLINRECVSHFVSFQFRGCS